MRGCRPSVESPRTFRRICSASSGLGSSTAAACAREQERALDAEGRQRCRLRGGADEDVCADDDLPAVEDLAQQLLVVGSVDHQQRLEGDLCSRRRRLRRGPECDEIVDRCDGDVVADRERLEVWDPRDRTVLVQDLADHRARHQPGDPAEVDRRLRCGPGVPARRGRARAAGRRDPDGGSPTDACPDRARLRIVFARSWTQIPVVVDRWSIGTANGVSHDASLIRTIGPMRSASRRDASHGMHSRPRPCVIMKFRASGVANSRGHREVAFVLTVRTVDDDHDLATARCAPDASLVGTNGKVRPPCRQRSRSRIVAGAVARDVERCPARSDRRARCRCANAEPVPQDRHRAPRRDRRRRHRRTVARGSRRRSSSACAGCVTLWRATNASGFRTFSAKRSTSASDARRGQRATSRPRRRRRPRRRASRRRSRPKRSRSARTGGASSVRTPLVQHEPVERRHDDASVSDDDAERQGRRRSGR